MDKYVQGFSEVQCASQVQFTAVDVHGADHQHMRESVTGPGRLFNRVTVATHGIAVPYRGSSPENTAANSLGVATRHECEMGL